MTQTSSQLTLVPRHHTVFRTLIDNHPRDHVRVAYAAIGGGSTPVWIAKDAGIFEEEGIDAELELIRGSGAVTRALLAGEVQFANIAAPAVLQANLRGGDVRYLTGGINGLVQTLIVRPEIQDAAQLRGKTLGESGSGDIDSFVSEVFFKPYGLELGKDVKTAHIANQPDALRQLEEGTIDAAIFSPPHQFEAVKRGFKVLIDAWEQGIEYQLGGIIARASYIAEHEDLVRRFVRAYVRGVHRYKTDGDFVVGILRKYSHVEDAAIARQSWQAQDRCFQRVPYPTVKGIQAILDQLATRNPAARTARAESMVDLRFVRELEDSGFIQRLYSK
jgi:NitT/TauT family transport system substrate-binding protein